VPRGTQVFTRSLFGFAYKAFTFCGGPLPGPSATKKVSNSLSLKTGESYNLPSFLKKEGIWAYPRSLAAT